jgi:hypothetical protein
VRAAPCTPVRACSPTRRETDSSPCSPMMPTSRSKRPGGSTSG